MINYIVNGKTILGVGLFGIVSFFTLPEPLWCLTTILVNIFLVIINIAIYFRDTG